eukprot:CAMPEP_0181127342 /NCGR_PEP_ID=MMETSP1071-20121207/28142_1 /TAXON_ID=35127 /ORGANISM="Thalassiosira sp., Strain NH16" /LENGTH=172 /DNA_ID=CAMNT_0023213065 /DNA_START=54 /DNA_END=572 /DNA_ORIENTATION=+
MSITANDKTTAAAVPAVEKPATEVPKPKPKEVDQTTAELAADAAAGTMTEDANAEAPAKEAVDATTQPAVKTSTDVAPSKDTDTEADTTKEEAQTEEETAVESKKRSADNAAIADEEKDGSPAKKVDADDAAPKEDPAAAEPKDNAAPVVEEKKIESATEAASVEALAVVQQ